MPPTPAKVPEVAPPPDLAAMTTEQLRAALNRSLARTAAEITRLAWVVRLLEERGEDLSDLRIGLLAYLRQIAYGRLVPEAVVRVASSPAVLQLVAVLPTPEQKQLAAGGPVTLVVRRADDAFDRREVDPLHLTPAQRRQVFARDHLRGEAEQTVLLEARGPEKEVRPGRFGKVVADPRRGGIRVGKTFVPAADAVAALAGIRAREGDAGGPETVVVVRLTESQHKSLKLAAVRGGVDMQTLIRRSLEACGLFGNI